MEENVIQMNGGIMLNVHVNVKNITCGKKIISNPATGKCQNSKHLASIMDNSAKKKQKPFLQILIKKYDL